jgi:ADP-heptose:LPS heptosyltransferase
VRAVAPEARDLIGKIPLASLGGVLARCTAVVANDSAPMHIARGLGVPTLAIFGSTDPGQFDFTGHALLFAGVDCAPCHFYGRRACPRGHFRCMLDLDVQRAWQALEPLLDGARRPLVRG